MKVIETSVKSKRNSDIPVTIVEADNYPAKLLICAHGFKAKRTEDGRFLTVAKALASKGVMAIMMGFPGCDESKEDFINYTLLNCMDDIDSCVDYVKGSYELTKDTGMIGYSMGGRLTSLYIAKHPEISCIGLWASASYDSFNGEDQFLGVPLSQMEEEIKEKGYCDFHNLFDDTYIKLNGELIEQMKELSPVKGLNDYKGCAIVVHGDEDTTVPYEVAEKTYEELCKAKERKLYTVHEADHGFGQWNGRPELSKQLTDETIVFFKEHFV